MLSTFWLLLAIAAPAPPPVTIPFELVNRHIAIDGRPAAEWTLTAILQPFERPIARRVQLRRGDRTLLVTWTPRVMV